MANQNFNIKISPGRPAPFGAHRIGPDLINFALHSRSVQTLSLCLFSENDLSNPFQVIPLDPKKNRTGHVWHIAIQNPPLPLYYVYRAENINLLDPYAKATATTNQWQGGVKDYIYKPYGVVNDDHFDWGNDVPLNLPVEDLIIYEMHVRSFTRHSSSKVKNPGTFLGMIEKIPHLIDLGVNAVELLPIHEFNENEYKRENPVAHKLLCNYWGYSTVNFFSPMQRYAAGSQAWDAVNEFKTLVKELHKNGIEVILDVVFNHTAEGNQQGPIYNFKELDNNIFYLIDPKGNYLNYSGCGNTLNCNHPIVREFILSSLRYWVTEMHVDGFRFDLASILTRDWTGRPMHTPPIIHAIAEDPILSKTKLIAEAWDAAGLYQVGDFFMQSERWSEWNGRYRDSVRRFIKGTGHKGDFVTNLCGSEDMYGKYFPCMSVNFIIAHDGFSLADLVSYNDKHNLANGEHNRDGANSNDSWNCGVEGETDNPEILALRLRQMKNFQVALMLSRGIPMILMGDEYGHTRKGNNNVWCQDNELNWFLWDQLEKNQDLYRFYKLMIKFRKEHPLLRKNKFLSPSDIECHGEEPFKPDWDQPKQFIAIMLKDPEWDHELYVAFNATNTKTSIKLPDPPEGKLWHCVANTSLPSPRDFHENPRSEETVMPETCDMEPYSCLLLEAYPT